MSVACDICGQPATVIRPETRNREEAVYCVYDASKSLGWGDSFRVLTEEDERRIEEARS